MRSAVRRKMEMAERVRVFVRANPLVDPGHQAAATQFEGRLTVAQGLLERQANGRLTAKATHEMRKALRREISEQYLRHLVTVAEMAGKGDPNRFGLFRRPTSKATNVAFATALRSMLAAAREAGDELKTHGLGESLLTDFERAVAQLDDLNRAATEARAAHVGATKDLERLGAGVIESVGVLDGIYRYRLATDPERLARWSSVRNVFNPIRDKAAPPPVEGGADRATT